MSSPRSPRLFDRWSMIYDEPRLQRAAYRPLHDAVLVRAEGLDPGVVVDLGCGTGRLTRRTAAQFSEATVVGVDFSAGMLRVAIEQAAGVTGSAGTYVQADAVRLPLAPGSVDLVVCSESFHWYPDQAGVLEGVHRLLAPGGRLLIVSTAAITGFGAVAVRRVTRLGGQPVDAVPPHRLRRLLAAAGFDVLHQRRVPRFGFPWPVLTDARRS